MKGKKVLSAIITGVMVLVTMSFSVFAADTAVATITKSNGTAVDYSSYDGEAGVFANVQDGDTVTFHTETVECANREFPSAKNVTYTSIVAILVCAKCIKSAASNIITNAAVLLFENNSRAKI